MRRSFRRSARSNAPASAHAAYRIGAACPLDSTKRSLSRLCGSFGSNRISAKNNAAMTSAIEQQLVGCPLPASEVERIESIRSRVAMFFKAGTSRARSMAICVRRFYRKRQQFAEREPVDRRAIVEGARRQRRQHPRRIGAIVGVRRQDRARAIVRIVVKRGEAGGSQ